MDAHKLVEHVVEIPGAAADVEKGVVGPSGAAALQPLVEFGHAHERQFGMRVAKQRTGQHLEHVGGHGFEHRVVEVADDAEFGAGRGHQYLGRCLHHGGGQGIIGGQPRRAHRYRVPEVRLGLGQGVGLDDEGEVALVVGRDQVLAAVGQLGHEVGPRDFVAIEPAHHAAEVAPARVGRRLGQYAGVGH